MESNNTKQPSLFVAILPIVFLVTTLTINIIVFGNNVLEGASQIAIILASIVGGVIAVFYGVKWDFILEYILKNINTSMNAILILFLIGSLSGTWLVSGVVPAMIYYGLQILNPNIFLVVACIICAIVSVASGSSWSTVATVGIALLGIGKALHIHEGLVAGSIISGAYFGDKVSPMSDTTNLAPAVSGTDLFTHIKYMLYTTIPSMTITLIIYLVLGIYQGSSGTPTDIDPILSALDSKFNINGWLFLVPIIVLVLIIKNTPAIPAMLIGTFLGALFALLFQQHIITEISGSPEKSFVTQAYIGVMKSVYTTVSIKTGNELVDALLITNGMAGMLKTIWLILTAMVFGGVMEAGGFLKTISSFIISKVHKTWSLIAATTGTCVFFNSTASDQYMAIAIPGGMYKEIYRKRGLKPENLSRTLEDAGTVTSVLIPWNTCGATQSSVLGISTFVYAPYCFFNIISPLMTIFFAVCNIKIRRFSNPPATQENTDVSERNH